MKKEYEDFLKLINNGSLAGAQTKLAKILNVSTAAVSKWFQGVQEPSEDNIKKMAHLSHKTINEIQAIFSISKSDTNLYNEKLLLKDKELELANQKILFLQEQVAFYKSKAEIKK